MAQGSVGDGETKLGVVVVQKPERLVVGVDAKEATRNKVGIQLCLTLWVVESTIFRAAWERATSSPVPPTSFVP